jgi:excisionase family DNA binding protein
MSEASARRFWTIDETAKFLGVSSKTAYRWAIAGDLPALRIRHTLRVDGAALEELYRRQQAGAAAKGGRHHR